MRWLIEFGVSRGKIANFPWRALLNIYNQKKVRKEELETEDGGPKKQLQFFAQFPDPIQFLDLEPTEQRDVQVPGRSTLQYLQQTYAMKILSVLA